MSKPALFRLGAASIARQPAGVVLPASEDRTVPQVAMVEPERSVTAEDKLSAAQKLQKSFQLHIGAALRLPTRTTKIAGPAAVPMAAQPLELSRADYFDGLPLKAWAERLGERVMPTVELVKEENRRVRAAAQAKLKSATSELPVPAVPHLLPFTRWAASCTSVQNTLVAEEPKKRQRARLSWYHPDDTMVPRDWFKGGLLADLKYYRPFSNAS